MELAKERCEACRPNSPMVTDAELPALLAQVPEWEMIERDGIKRLRRSYRFDAWMAGIKFASQVGEIAEQEDHHPSMAISWGKVTVTWWTHAIGGLHRNDFIMAKRSDLVFAQSPEAA